MAVHEPIECPRVHALLRAGQRVNSRALDEPAVQAHLQACSACAVLAESLSESPRSPADAGPSREGNASLGGTLADAEHETQPELSIDEIDRMLAAVETQTQDRPPPVERMRQASTRTRSLVLFGGALAIVGLTGVLSPRVEFSAYPLARVLGAIAALIAAVLASGAVVMRPLHRRPMPGWLLGVLAGFAVITPGIIAALPAPAGLEVTTGQPFVTHALACFMFGMVFALVLIGVAWLVERSGLRRRASTVLGLVGAGAMANLLLVLHCPDPAPLHKLAGHASISAVLLAVAGAVAWWLTVRPGARGT